MVAPVPMTAFVPPVIVRIEDVASVRSPFVMADSLLLKVFQSAEERYPSDEAPDCVILIVPVVVMVPPCMGAVVAMEVTVPVPPVAAMVKVG